MQLIILRRHIFGLFILLFFISSCNSKNKDLEYQLLQDFFIQYDHKVALYDESTIYGFTDVLELPLTKNKLQARINPKSHSIKRLLSKQDIEDWNKAINNYSPVFWDSTKLHERKVISKKPDYMSEHALKPPPTGETYPIDTILYLSPPFFNSTKDKAIMYVRQYYGPLQSASFYYILVKKNKCWFLITRGLLTTS